MQRYSFVASIGGCLLASCAAAPAQAVDTIRCRQLEIVDADGRVVIRLDTQDQDGHHPRLQILDRHGVALIVLGLVNVGDDSGKSTGVGAMLHLETGDGIVTLATSDKAGVLNVVCDDKSSLTVTASEKLVEERIGSEPK